MFFVIFSNQDEQGNKVYFHYYILSFYIIINDISFPLKFSVVIFQIGNVTIFRKCSSGFSGGIKTLEFDFTVWASQCKDHLM